MRVIFGTLVFAIFRFFWFDFNLKIIVGLNTELKILPILKSA